MTFLKDNSIKDDTSVPGLVEAKEVLKRSNMTEAERNIYLRHIEAMRNEKSATDYSYASGKVDGRAEGLAEGVKQQAITTARSMKVDGMPVDVISKYTGLTPSEISKI